jgi:hypothetical protein
MYSVSQKDVPEFNNLLLEYNITQVNIISIDGKGKLAKFLSGTLQMFNICSTLNTTHIKPVINFLPHFSQHLVVNHCDGRCD